MSGSRVISESVLITNLENNIAGSMCQIIPV